MNFLERLGQEIVDKIIDTVLNDLGFFSESTPLDKEGKPIDLADLQCTLFEYFTTTANSVIELAGGCVNGALIFNEGSFKNAVVSIPIFKKEAGYARSALHEHGDPHMPPALSLHAHAFAQLESALNDPEFHEEALYGLVASEFLGDSA